MESNDYNCKICIKKYKTYQTLWKHNKKFHNTSSEQPSTNILMNSNNVLTNSNNVLINSNIKIYNCRICNKIFNNVKTRWAHEKKCKIKYDEIAKNNAENKQKEIDLQIKKEEAIILRLKLKLAQSDKIESITLKKLNKKLMERHNLIKNSTVNSHNNVHNIQNIQNINNFQLIGFGKEDITETLTNQDKKLIMNAKYRCLDKLVELVHCGNYDQFKNIIITNMKDNYMYKYDDKVGNFILSTKADVLNSLIDYRLGELEIIYNDLLEKNKLDENTKDIIEKFINKINYVDTKYTDYDIKEHDNYKQYKISEIKILLFNNQDKITNDISLLLTTSNDLDV